MNVKCRHYGCRLLRGRDLRARYVETNNLRYLERAALVHEEEVNCLAKTFITAHDIVMLETAISQWESWKGNLKPEDYDSFDIRIGQAKAALEKVKVFCVDTTGE